ncbi:hypothetical protein KFL_008320020 [Klebsormidium nitens]|uniref:Uncharacterized protein n=1 Tax=Klebsormidium nitens TaxID=105231 RepID=A0A1Y1IM03_KLENI|nr:hypothetical protein KFL_008320020 [Klebsormidium nitens]|eukprot:GAQ91673.1 hypothetical protein KFL_008320020 [Klebsormidium nitens]
MLPFRHGGAARPLLTLGEMLEDLAGEDVAGGAPPNAEQLEGARDRESGGTGTLEARFERALSETSSSLRNPGTSWIGPTQKLSSSLTTADQLISVAASELLSLSRKVDQAAHLVTRSHNQLEKLKSRPLS